MALRNVKRGSVLKLLQRCFTTGNESDFTTAGIIVIGDEILKGEVPDTNSTFLALELHKLGLQLKKISVIGDDVNEVSREVKWFSDSYNYVLTTGGIGPTHDDITYEGVAMAFDEPLVLNTELRDICMKFYNTTDANCPGMKLAYIPKSAKLNFNTDPKGSKLVYPNVSINNVYMFPGIPELLVRSFCNLRHILFKSSKRFYSKHVFVNLTEDKIVEVLDQLVKEYPNVQFGSYPKLYHRVYKVKVTIESSREELANQAYNKFMLLIPKQFIVELENV